MSPAEIAPTTSALTVADLNTEVNCEPRILDTRLGEALGFERPRVIRELIRRHAPALRALGALTASDESTSSKGGRPAKAFWLNRKQCLYVCTKSETDRATEQTIRVVEVYDEVTRGDAAPRPLPPPRREPPKLLEAPPITVREHLRRARTEVGARDRQGVVMLDGKPVFFEAGVRPAIGDPALVVLHNGTLAVFPAEEGYHPSEPGKVVVRDEPKRPGAKVTYRSIVTLVGAVTTPSGRPKRLR